MKLTPIIESILVSSQEARDSDRELIIQVLHRLMSLTPEQERVIRSVVFESITRCRRKLQEQGKYLPSPEVARERRLKSYAVQQNAPSASPQRLQTIIADEVW